MNSMGVDLTIARGRRTVDHWRIITSLVLDGISSPHTRRAYSQSLEEFLIWFLDDPGREFNKATVQRYRTELELKQLAPSSINVRLSAIRRLALEAADNGLMDSELAAGIMRAQGPSLTNRQIRSSIVSVATRPPGPSAPLNKRRSGLGDSIT